MGKCTGKSTTRTVSCFRKFNITKISVGTPNPPPKKKQDKSIPWTLPLPLKIISIVLVVPDSTCLFKTLRLQDCIVPMNSFNFSVINVINYYQWRLPIHTILKYMYRYLLSVFWNTDLPVYTYSTKIILGGRTRSVYSRNSCIKKWDSIFNLLNFFYPSSRKHK